MKQKFNAIIVIGMLFMLTGCTENYSNGERVGLITQFSNTGVVWKSWEGHLNLTQTGMNSSSVEPFDFSIDNDHPNEELKKSIDSAAEYGWKVKLTYHETFGKNWFKNRGETDHFIMQMEILDKNPVASAFKGSDSLRGRIIDTIYVVIDRSK